ncbi:hypothetical protein RZS08_08510, partial [Arthrospira platensis SPKY1]|nr:hypothetical protein [Arthrospira platensis SPKY1]
HRTPVERNHALELLAQRRYVQARLKPPAAHRVGGGVVSAHERAGKLQSQGLLGRIEHLFIFLQPDAAPRRHSVTKKRMEHAMLDWNLGDDPQRPSLRE